MFTSNPNNLPPNAAAADSGSLGCGNLAYGGPLHQSGETGAITMRKGKLAAAVAVLAVACSACSGSSHSSAVQHPGTTSSGLGGAASGTGVSWTSYHGDAEAAGVQGGQTNLLPSQRAWTSPKM